MPKFILNKLVRDKLIATYEKLGQKATYKTLSKPEHFEALKQKVTEEIKEVSAEARKETDSE